MPLEDNDPDVLVRVSVPNPISNRQVIDMDTISDALEDDCPCE